MRIESSSLILMKVLSFGMYALALSCKPSLALPQQISFASDEVSPDSRAVPAPSFHIRFLLRLLNGPRIARYRETISGKPKGPGEKGAPRGHPEISSQKLLSISL